MRKFLAITIMVIMAGTASAQEGVTFVVDENLAPIEKKYHRRKGSYGRIAGEWRQGAQAYL